MLNKYFDYFDVESKQGLIRLLFCSIFLMTLMHLSLCTDKITFPKGIASDADYWSMIIMGSFLIALDAMLLVALNFRRLVHPIDALVLATMVGVTHVVFPLITFALTAVVYFPFKNQLLPPEMAVLSIGVISAIYFIATHFVMYHLREVLNNLYSHDVDEAPEGLRSWSAINSARPVVITVSIDALIVGPAKIAFADRYTNDMFLMSFVYVGIGVFALVLMSGIGVILLRLWLHKKGLMERFVRIFDYWSCQLLAIVFFHFALFAGFYLLYTFSATEMLLETKTLWAATLIVSTIFLVKINRSKLRKAVFARVDAIQSETVT